VVTKQVVAVTRPLVPLVVTDLAMQLVVARQLMLAQPNITKISAQHKKRLYPIATFFIFLSKYPSCSDLKQHTNFLIHN
jgi:hypothetical protein